MFVTEDSPVNLEIKEKKEEISIEDIEAGIDEFPSAQNVDVAIIYSSQESKHPEVSERINQLQITKKKSTPDVFTEENPGFLDGLRKTRSKLDVESNDDSKFSPIVPGVGSPFGESPFVNYARPPKSKPRKVDDSTVILMDTKIAKLSDSPVDETFLSYNDGLSNNSDEEDPIVYVNYSRPSSRNSSIGGKVHSRMNSFQLNNMDIILDDDIDSVNLEKEIARGGFKSPKKSSSTDNVASLFPLRRSASNDNITASAIASMPKSPSHDQIQRVLWKSSDLKDNVNSIEETQIINDTKEEKI